MLINANLASATTGQIQKTSQKQESPEPKDSFQTGTSKEEQLSYGENLLKSTIDGAVAGFIKVGEAVEHVLPSVDGLDNTGLHLFLASISIAAGAFVGAPIGAVAGFAMGLIGKNIDIPET